MQVTSFFGSMTLLLLGLPKEMSPQKMYGIEVKIILNFQKKKKCWPETLPELHGRWIRREIGSLKSLAWSLDLTPLDFSCEILKI